MRGGMGSRASTNRHKFIDAGGLFVTITGNASIPIDYGWSKAVSIVSAPDLRVRGSVLNSTVTDKRRPHRVWLWRQAGALLQFGAGALR